MMNIKQEIWHAWPNLMRSITNNNKKKTIKDNMIVSD